MMTDLVDSYVSMRRAMGFKFASEGASLMSFGEYANARGEAFVTRRSALEWAALSSTPCSRAIRLSLVAGLSRYLHAEDCRHELVPCGVFGRVKNPRQVSYIFSQDEIRRILEDASKRAKSSPLLPHAYRTLFGLLACTGMRISEALALRFNDVTADGLIIRQTKFRKSRLVPLHPSAEQHLTSYIAMRKRLAPLTDSHLFMARNGRPMSQCEASWIFRTCLRRLGIKAPPGVLNPSVHTLRHTFAVRVLESCSDQRDKIDRNAVALSTYLGHVNAISTYWYLDATKKLLNNIADSCESSWRAGK